MTLEAVLKAQLLEVTKVIDLIVAKRLEKLDDAGLMSLFDQLHQWARGVLHEEGPLEGPIEGAPFEKEGPHVKFKNHLPFTLVKLAHSHPLWVKIERELIRRDCEASPLSLEEETSIILALRSNNKEKGWTK